MNNWQNDLILFHEHHIKLPGFFGYLTITAVACSQFMEMNKKAQQTEGKNEED